MGNKNGGNIALESYYTYGSSVSVEHKYKTSNGKYKTVKKTDSSYHDGSAVECVAGGSGAGISTTFHAGAYGVSFDKDSKLLKKLFGILFPVLLLLAAEQGAKKKLKLILYYKTCIYREVFLYA